MNLWRKCVLLAPKPFTHFNLFIGSMNVGISSAIIEKKNWLHRLRVSLTTLCRRMFWVVFVPNRRSCSLQSIHNKNNVFVRFICAENRYTLEKTLKSRVRIMIVSGVHFNLKISPPPPPPLLLYAFRSRWKMWSTDTRYSTGIAAKVVIGHAAIENDGNYLDVLFEFSYHILFLFILARNGIGSRRLAPPKNRNDSPASTWMQLQACVAPFEENSAESRSK